MTTTRDKALQWLATGNVGMSSKTMMMHFEGIKNLDERHPLDPADFLRCHQLLTWVPEYRERLAELRTLSPVWDKLVE